MKKQTKQIYNLTQAEIFKKFSVKPEGLSQEEVQSRLLKFGKNKIFRKHNWHRLRLIGNQFNDTLVWILAVAALMSIFFGEKQDAVIIVVIILVNAIIGFFQEFRAERILENIRKLTRDTAVVIRGGKKEEIETVGIVPGDVVFVSSGENIAADGYLIESFEFKVKI